MAKATENPFAPREPAIWLELDKEVGGVGEVILHKPTGADLLVYLEHDDDHERNVAVYSRIVAPAKGEKITGDQFERADIEAMSYDDIVTFDNELADLMALEEMNDYVPDGDILELEKPIDTAFGVVKRLKFEPKTYGQMKRYTKATGQANRVRKFIEVMAADPDNDDTAMGPQLIDQLSAQDVGRIMFGFLGRTTKKSRKSKRLS